MGIPSVFRMVESLSFMRCLGLSFISPLITIRLSGNQAVDYMRPLQRGP